MSNHSDASLVGAVRSARSQLTNEFEALSSYRDALRDDIELLDTNFRDLLGDSSSLASRELENIEELLGEAKNNLAAAIDLLDGI